MSAGGGPSAGPAERPAAASPPPDTGPTIRAGAFVVHEGRLLLVRQRRLRSQDDYWLLPGGGLEFGETLAEALVREAGEELGIGLDPIRPIAVVESISPDPAYQKHVVHVVIAAAPAGSAARAPVPRDPDVLEARFFAPAELETLQLRPPIAPELRRYLEGLPAGVEHLGRRW